MEEPDEGTILIVDDQPSTALETILRADGYRVLAVNDGPSALALALQEQVDLVLLDIAMPNMDGYEVMRRLRGQPGGKTLPILLVSAFYTESEDAAHGLDIGADDYIPKPANASELRARIAAKFRQRQLERALQAARDEAETQNDLLRRSMRVLQDAAHCLDPESLLATIQRGLSEELLIPEATVWLFQEGTGRLIPTSDSAAPLPEGVEKASLSGADLSQVGARVLVPMRRAGVLVGLLDVEWVKEWPKGTSMILQALADSLAILFQTTRYMQQIARENRLHQLLNKLASQDAPLPEMLQQLGTFLKVELLLMDRWFNLMASDPDASFVRQEELRPEIIELYQARRLREQVTRRGDVVLIKGRGSIPTHQIVPVVLGGEVTALLLCVPGTARQPAPVVAVGELERAAQFLGGVLQRHQESALREQHLRADFLNDFLAGRIGDEMSRTTLFLRANALGLNLALPGFVAEIELPRFSQQVDWSQPLFQQRVSELLTPLLRDVRRVRTLLNLDGIETMIGERVVAIVSMPVRTSEEQARTWAARWAHQLLAQHRQHLSEDELPAIGLGRLATDWRELPRSANEAERALRWVLSNARTKVAYYGDLGSERLLAAINDHTELERFREEQLGPVIAYDESKTGELVRTLQVFFANGGHMTRSAEVLSVHPNTLKYRLDQVMHLTGRDPRDYSLSLDLQLALKIHNML